MFSDFKIRSLTAAGLAFLCFLALFLGHFYLKLFIYFLSAILFFEWMRIISQTQWIIRGLIALVFSSFVYFILLTFTLCLIIVFLSCFFLCPNKFAEEIEKLVLAYNFNYIDAILTFCEENKIEMESVSKLISLGISSIIFALTVMYFPVYLSLMRS